MTLQEQLKNESAKLNRISERCHAGRLALEAAQSELRNASGDLEAEMSAAVLEDREPRTVAMQTKIAKFQGIVDSKKAELSGADVALTKQRQTVEGVDGQIAATARQRVKLSIAPKSKRLHELIDEITRLSAEVIQEGAPFYLQHTEFFPNARDHYEAGLRLAIMNSTFNLRAYLSHFVDTPFSQERGRVA